MAAPIIRSRGGRARRRGQGAVEYALVLAVIAVVVIAAVTVVGRRTSTSFCGVNRGLEGAAPPVGTSYASAVLGDNPAAYYRLGEAAGATVAVDLSAAQSSGLYTGTRTLGVTGALHGDADTAASFDGSTGYMSAPNLAVGSTDSALEIWANITGAAQGAFIHVGNVTAGFEIGIGGINFDTPGTQLIGAFNHVNWLPTGRLLSNGWHHVVLDLNGSGFPTVYLDGAAVYYTNTLGTAGAAAPNVLSVANSINGNGPTLRAFAGTLDEAAVYAHALTAAQIQNHYLWGINGC